MRRQAEACTFAPHLARLTDLIHGLPKGLVHLSEVLLGARSLVLQLYEHGPKSALGKVVLKTVLDDGLSVTELTHPHVHHDSLELYLPLSVRLGADPVHNFESTRILTNHLVELGVFEEAYGYLLEGHFHTRSLNAEPCLYNLALIQHNTGCNEPYLPLDAVRAVRCHGRQVLFRFQLITEPVEGLGQFNIDFPVIVFADVSIHIFNDVWEFIKFTLPHIFVNFFVQL